jgi:ABC-type Fe3+/spermidine/putrescine transport system ATPase subunit
VTLELRDVHFRYSGGPPLLKGLDLSVGESELASLLGSSGSGKTTVLNLIAGFLRPTRGDIILDSKDIVDIPTRKRGVGVVFQDYALFPHMNVEKNVAYGVKGGSRDVKGKVNDLLSSLELDGYGDRHISELSGGEKQRVSLARTLAREPRIILLDEPLSALDARLRDGLRRDLRRVLKDLGTAALYVTHDQMEAISISDRINFLYRGMIWESGRPSDLFNRPERIETAGFMGFENVFKVSGRSVRKKIVDIPGDLTAYSYVGFRPESVSMERAKDSVVIRGKVTSREFRGREMRVEADTDWGKMIGYVPVGFDFVVGEEYDFYVGREDIIPFHG